MHRFYFYLLIITINGFTPLGRFNSIYTLISWLFISNGIFYFLKKRNINFIKKIIFLYSVLALIYFALYFLPYLDIYNSMQLKDVLVSTFNGFIFLIAGIECRFTINAYLKKIFNRDQFITKDLKSLLQFQRLNILISGILILGTYLTKYILFSPLFISMFIPGNNLGYDHEIIDFSSINFLSLSINSCSRNSYILIPLALIYISIMIIKKVYEKINQINLYSIRIEDKHKINQINQLFVLNYLFCSSYLICSSSRVGILIGYLLILLFILVIFKIYSQKKKIWFLTLFKFKKQLTSLISIFIILIFLVPFNLFFPLSGRQIKPYNTIFLNSTIPIIHEIKISYLLFMGNEDPIALLKGKRMAINLKEEKEMLNNKFLNHPIYDQFSLRKHFRQYKSSSVMPRLEIYKSKENKVIHESFLLDLLNIFRLGFLTIPLMITYTIIFSILFLKFIYISIDNKVNIKNANIYYYFFLKNAIPIFGTIFFIFNSINSPNSALCIGFMYIIPSLRYLPNLKPTKQLKDLKDI